MTAILGISAYYHDAAAALVVDGQVVAAAQEERFTRVKHDPSFPEHALAWCLEHAGLAAGDLDYVAFYDKPLLKFERILETYLGVAPRGFGSFLRAMPIWLKQKLHTGREIRRRLGDSYGKRVVFAEHHESHAASAFYPSPFERAAVLTLDGVGEWATASWGIGDGNALTIREELRFPHSLGLLYSAFTYFCGFRVNFGEYKLMGLAPYGRPRYRDALLGSVVDVKPDGSLRLDLSYFAFHHGRTMTNRKLDRLLGRPPRRPESDLTQDDMDLAASLQSVTEEVVLRAVRHVHARTGLDALCLAGGVALNCVANGRILREGPFEHLWIQPAAGDAGGALGVALLIWHKLLETERVPARPDGQAGSLLGPHFDTEDVCRRLDALGATYRVAAGEETLLEEVAGHLADGKVVGWMQGPMEFGPRALGCRSILGDPRLDAMQTTMNRKIKFRESFRPFAPSVLVERVHEYFEMEEGQDSPYMLLVAGVHPDRLVDTAEDDTIQGLERLRVRRSEIPAVTHVDGSARVQTVDAVRHGRYHRLLRRFEERTGCPVLINTSFNVRGEPIVCTPEDAWKCFLGTDMDVLVIEDCVLLKQEQPEDAVIDARAYLDQYDLD